MPEENLSLTENTQTDDRLVWLDLLRIAASLLIVMLNLTAAQLKTMPLGAADWQTINLYLGLARAATPLFTMMSGVLFLGLGKQRSLEQLLKGPVKKLVVIYLFWSLLYAVFTVFTQPAPLTAALIPSLIKLTLAGSDHMWFLHILICLYLISPFLQQILDHSDSSIWKYGVLLMALGLLGHTLLMGADFLSFCGLLQTILYKFPLGHVIFFAGYFLLGNFLRQYTQPNALVAKLAVLAMVIGVLANAGLTYFASKQTGSTNLTLSLPLSIMTFMIAVPIFWLFQGPVSQVKVSPQAGQTIATIARQTLGVYLIHPMVFYGLDKLAHFTPLSFNPLFSVPILTLLTVLLSALIIYILKKLPYLCWIA